MQIVAPRSIKAELWAHDRPSGTSESAMERTSRTDSRESVTRARTRPMLVSTTATSCSKAKQRTADAVYGPIPGKAKSAASVSGKPCSTMVADAIHSHLARRGYPSPFQKTSTSSSGVAANVEGSGQRSINACHLGNTRSICVCWDMTSITRIDHGSRVLRHGRSRRDVVLQSARSCWIADRSEGSSFADTNRRRFRTESRSRCARQCLDDWR